MTKAPEAEDARARLKLDAIDFVSGDALSLASDSILAIVGPNNSGKSLTLREILGLLAGKLPAPKSVRRVSITKSGDDAALVRHLAEWAVEKKGAAHWFGGHILNPATAVLGEWLRKDNDRLGHSATLFALLLTADERIQATKPANRIRLEQEPAQVPIHRLEAKLAAETDVSAAFERVFGQEIALNRNAGKEVPIHVGKRPKAELFGGELSVKYCEEVTKLPLIGDQGDGMVAFLGLLLYVVGVPRDIYLIDEPDVYLHPPQAYTAGRLLAEKTAGRQLMVATHNAHFFKRIARRGERSTSTRSARSHHRCSDCQCHRSKSI